MPPVYDFTIRRSGEESVACSVPWRFEGTGSNPLTGVHFAGGVLPSGTASFAAGVTSQPASFTTAPGVKPTTDLTGRLVLHSPVGCKLDPDADRHDLAVLGENPPGDATFPYGPWWVWVRATSGPNRKPVSNAGALRDAIRDAQSGHQILLPQGGNIALGGDLVIERAVSGNDAYYIATDTDSDDPASFCQLSGGDIIIDGAKRLVMNGIKQVGDRLRPHNAERCQFERFEVDRVVNSDPENSYAADGWFNSGLKDGDKLRAGFKVDNIFVGFVNYSECTASFMDQFQSGSPTRALFTHIHWHEAGSQCKILQPGRNPEHGMVDTGNILQYGLDTDPRRISTTDWIELKTNGWRIQHNTIYDGNLVKIRQGRIAARPGVAGPEKGNLFLGNLFITAGAEMSMRGAYHAYINNWCIKSGSPTLDSPLGNGRIQPYVGVSNGKTFPETDKEDKGNNRLASGYAMRAGGNRGFTISPKYNTRGDPQFEPADCIATATGRGRNSSVAAGDSHWGSGLDTSTQLEGANIDKIPVMMTGSTAGARPWRTQFAQVYRP